MCANVEFSHLGWRFLTCAVCSLYFLLLWGMLVVKESVPLSLTCLMSVCVKDTVTLHL